MRYRYQFLLDLYRNRKFHPDHMIWLYRYEHIIENGHYLKVYLYRKNPYMKLEEVSFQYSQSDKQQMVSVKDFYSIKKHYQPYLLGCILPVDADVEDTLSLNIISYQMNGKTYAFAQEDTLITLSEEQRNKARNALLLRQMDITMMPLMEDSFYLCACGHIHRIGETCPNCHRPFRVIKELVEKGQAALCKEALLQEYCTLTELEKRKYKSDSWIKDIQEEAASLNIELTSKDYESFLSEAKHAHRKEIAGSLFLAFPCALVITFSIILFIGIQASAYDTYHDSVTSYYNDSGYDDESENTAVDNEEDVRNSTCSLHGKNMSFYVTLASHYDVISNVILTVEMNEEQLGADPKQLNQSTLDHITTDILSQFGLQGTEKGIDYYVSTDDTSLQIDIFINLDSVKNKTLSALGLDSIEQLSYDQALSAFVASGMDCE